MLVETATFTGPFAKNIKDYISEKQSVGNKIESYIYSLKSFDTFSKQYTLKSDILTKDLLNEWLKIRPNEKRTNQASRANIIRGFSKYMNLIDKKSYILPNGLYSCNDNNAYIYSEYEISLIFDKIDRLVEEQPNKQKKNCSFQIIFRLLYMCGLRISEALNIKLQDLDYKQKLVVIKYAKKDKNRIIPINDKLNNLIMNYIEMFHAFSNDDDFFIF